MHMYTGICLKRWNYRIATTVYVLTYIASMISSDRCGLSMHACIVSSVHNHVAVTSTPAGETEVSQTADVSFWAEQVGLVCTGYITGETAVYIGSREDAGEHYSGLHLILPASLH